MAKRRRVQVKSSATRKEFARDFSEKKRLQRRKALRLRAVIGAGVITVLAGSVQLWQWHRSGTLQEVAAMPGELWHAALAGAGLRIEQVYVHGRSHASTEQVAAAIAAPRGSSLLAVNLADVRSELMKIPEVKRAQVRRELPSKLHVTLHERTPEVLWQHEGKHTLMDREGVVLDAAKYGRNQRYLVVVGADAPPHLPALLSMLASEPVMAAEVKAAVRVGARRWNLVLTNDTTVMLPEQDSEFAWQRFAKLAKEKALLTHAVRSVDMRLSERVLITPLPPADPLILSSAKRT